MLGVDLGESVERRVMQISDREMREKEVKRGREREKQPRFKDGLNELTFGSGARLKTKICTSWDILVCI